MAQAAEKFVFLKELYFQWYYLEGEGLNISSVKLLHIVIKLWKENGSHFHAYITFRVGTNKIVRQFGFDGFSTDGFQSLIYVCVAKTIAVL